MENKEVIVLSENKLAEANLWSQIRSTPPFHQCSLQSLDFSLCYIYGIPSSSNEIPVDMERFKQKPEYIPMFNSGAFGPRDKVLGQFLPEFAFAYYGWTPVLKNILDEMKQEAVLWNGNKIALKPIRLSIGSPDLPHKIMTGNTGVQIMPFLARGFVNSLSVTIEGFKKLYEEYKAVIEEKVENGSLVHLWVCNTQGNLRKGPSKSTNFPDAIDATGTKNLTHSICVFKIDQKSSRWRVQDGYTIHDVDPAAVISSALLMHFLPSSGKLNNMDGVNGQFHIILDK